MARKIRNGILLLLAAAIAAFAVWMLWPRSLTETLDLDGQDLVVSVLASGVEIIRDECVLSSQPFIDQEQYILPAESEQAEAVLEALDGYTWHPCWDTLTGKTGLSGIGDLSVALYVPRDGERAFAVYSGTGKIRLNGRIVRLDYFGNGAAGALCREMADHLRGNSGVAN